MMRTVPPSDPTPAADPAVVPDVDPVLVRRRRIAVAVRWGQSIGYSLFAVAIVAFVLTKLDRPTPLLTGVIAASMGVGSVLLAPAIVFGYAVKAAEREDRERAAQKAARLAAAEAKRTPR